MLYVNNVSTNLEKMMFDIHYPKEKKIYDLGSSSSSITWKLVKNGESQTPSETYGSRICMVNKMS